MKCAKCHKRRAQYVHIKHDIQRFQHICGVCAIRLDELNDLQVGSIHRLPPQPKRAKR